MSSRQPVIYIPHGGGPLPLLGDPNHDGLVRLLKQLGTELSKPDAILMISAHWEESIPKLLSGPQPELIYDYYGFPEESYEIKYPAPGQPELASKVHAMLEKGGINSECDAERGFDHGMFVPLKLMFESADVPCVQLSLLQNLDPEMHIKMGEAIKEIRNQGVLVIGSGMSYHNLKAFFKKDESSAEQSQEFDQWLYQVCADASGSYPQSRQQLIQWKDAPSALDCHPREEHLLPLHVCFGIAGEDGAARRIFNEDLMGKRVSSFQWD